MNPSNQLLRFTTAGSVDDGKSTLIGRLLYDSKSIFEDQLEAVQRSSSLKGMEGIDLSLFTDGLKDEREQGITIDVAYRYFTTPRRKFIIADTPGHIQYTRNMVTGASTADAALILIDVRHGVVEQTRRHAYIASLLQIPHLLICVNKMDLVDYEQAPFSEVVRQFDAIASRLGISDIRYIPISALKGDNVVNPSGQMPWYSEGPLLHILEEVDIDSDGNPSLLRLPVQTVIRPQEGEFQDYRGYAGRLASGCIRVGDIVGVLPGGERTRVKSLRAAGTSVQEACAPSSVTVELSHDIDISRGDMIVAAEGTPELRQQLDLMMCWLNREPMKPGGRYFVRHNTSEHKARIQEVHYKVDIETLERVEDSGPLSMNEIARVRLKTSQPLFVDAYRQNRSGGSLILVDADTNETVAAGMVL